MNLNTLRARRMRNLGLVRPVREAPEEIVARMGAVQSQDHVPAKWAISQRCNADERLIEEAYARGAILRTHVLRPTWHFVTPRDIVWMLQLTAGRIERASGTAYRQLNLDAGLLKRCRRIVTRALTNEGHLTRKELGTALEGAGIATDARRLGYIAMHLEVAGVICSGRPRGKQHTYALLEERAPGAAEMSREDSLAELARRYLTSHGPATVKDLAWWSSLKISDVKHALEMIESELRATEVEGLTYYATETRRAVIKSPAVHLLQAYDEFLVGYTQSKFVADPQGIWFRRDGTSFLAVVMLDGQIVGRWRALRKRDRVVIEVDLMHALDAGARDALEQEAARYGRFLELPATVQEGRR